VSAARSSWLFRGGGVFWAIPAFYMVEIIWGGPIGVVPGLRYLAFLGAAGVLTAFLLLRGGVPREMVPPALAVAAFTLGNIVWATIVPMIQGTDLNLSLHEGRAFLVLPLAVIFLLVAGDRPRTFRSLQRLVVILSAVLAAVQVAIWVAGTLSGPIQGPIVFALHSLYKQSIYVGMMPDGFFRVFWISSLWCLLAIFWVPVAFAESRWKRPLQLLLVLCVFVTYSRGIWLGLAVAALAVHTFEMLDRNRISVLFRQLFAGFAILVMAGAGLALFGELDRVTDRFGSTASQHDVSITERVVQTQFLRQVWHENILIGGGYGAYSRHYIRDVEAPYSYENIPYALLAKLGIVGVTLMGGFLAYLALSAFLARARAGEQARSFVGGLISFLLATLTNPMLINFVGLSILACLMVQWAFIVSAPRPQTAPGVQLRRPAGVVAERN
jgi:hypothetical protein